MRIICVGKWTIDGGIIAAMWPSRLGGAAAVEPDAARAPPVARRVPPRAAHARASRTALHEAVNISVVE